jgi:thioredoxin-related protein
MGIKSRARHKKSKKSLINVDLTVIDEASNSGKPIMLFFHVSDESIAMGKRSKSMENFVFTNQRIHDTALKFHSVKIDAQAVDKGILKRYKVRTAPTVIFISSTGKVLTRVVGQSKPYQMLCKMKAVLQANERLIKKARRVKP